MENRDAQLVNLMNKVMAEEIAEVHRVFDDLQVERIDGVGKSLTLTERARIVERSIRVLTSETPSAPRLSQRGRSEELLLTPSGPIIRAKNTKKLLAEGEKLRKPPQVVTGKRHTVNLQTGEIKLTEGSDGTGPEGPGKAI